MKEPRRLLSHGATDFERQLLRAVVNERPSALLRSRMQRGLGLVGPLAWASTVKAMFGGAATKLAAVVLGGALVVGGGAAVWLWPGSEPEPAALDARSPAEEAAPVEAARVDSASATQPVAAPPALPALPEAPSSDAVSAAADSAEPGSAPAPAAAEPSAAEPAGVAELDGAGSDRQLREEIALIDAARAALQAGNRELARERLQVYGERFPEGILRREAKVLSRRAEPKRAKR